MTQYVRLTTVSCNKSAIGGFRRLCSVKCECIICRVHIQNYVSYSIQYTHWQYLCLSITYRYIIYIYDTLVDDKNLCVRGPACVESRSFRRTDVDKPVPKCNLTLFLFAPFSRFYSRFSAPWRSDRPLHRRRRFLVKLRRRRSLLRITYVSLVDCAAREAEGTCRRSRLCLTNRYPLRDNNRDWIILCTMHA